jgi:hypothetical protein
MGENAKVYVTKQQHCASGDGFYSTKWRGAHLRVWDGKEAAVPLAESASLEEIESSGNWKI